MRRVNPLLMAVVLAGLFVPTSNLTAQTVEPPSAPVTTMWRLFGIPQGVHKVRDATSNRFGKHPNLERTDAMLRIADPANIESDIPAIRVAAEAKAGADSTAQKVKAIRYLAEVGCECSSQRDMVEQALLAALDDCAEEVRYEAAMAFCKTTGQICERCNRRQCCSVESLRKLHEIATGKDDNGCWLEPSPDVRRAAGAAFERCRRAFDQVPTPVEPRETAEPPDQGKGPFAAEPTPVEPGEEPAPIDADLEELLSAPPTGMASSLGAASGPQGTGLYMLGDYPGQSGGVVIVHPAPGQGDIQTYPQEYTVPVPPALLRSVKIAENYSSIPRDRFFFNYSYFNNTVLGTPGAVNDVNRFIFGAEKTFFDGLTSLEVRVPFGATLNSDQRTNGTNFNNIEYGNTVLIGKAILHQSRSWVLAGGLGIGLPTADDTRIFQDNTLLLKIENNSVRLAPFLGIAATPSENFFVESVVQVDTAANRNKVSSPDWSQVGRLQEQSILFADLSVGYWLYREPLSKKRLQGIAPTVEIHYATSLEDAGSVGDPVNGTYVTSDAGNRFDYLNMTFGSHFVFAGGGTISPAVVVPMFGEDRRQFDYELQVQVNLFY